MPAILTISAVLLLFQSQSNLCESDVSASKTDPIIQDLFINASEPTIYVKANCPCYCSIEENTFYVFKINLDSKITQAWRFDGFMDLTMQKSSEIIAINKLPPNESGEQNFNTLKTLFKAAGDKFTSDEGPATPLSKSEFDIWAGTISAHSSMQKFDRAHQISLALFKKKNTKEAIAKLLPLRSELEALNKTEILNDLGFFLEQANRAPEAISVLEKVIGFDPSRAPAYLNLADAYSKTGDKEKAKANYLKYVELMEKSGKGAKVPARVRAFLKS